MPITEYDVIYYNSMYIQSVHVIHSTPSLASTCPSTIESVIGAGLAVSSCPAVGIQRAGSQPAVGRTVAVVPAVAVDTHLKTGTLPTKNTLDE